jgi:hypothetical protein
VGIKYKVDETFFEKWSECMAYVLGYIYADGNLIYSPNMRGKYVSIISVDEDSILRIKKWLNSEHTIKRTRSHFVGSKICYVLRIGSHKIYNDLTNYGLRPNKSLTVKLPNIPNKYFGHFIRGYFDGDGCIYLEKGMGKKGQQIIKRMRIIFTCGSKVFLVKMDNVLKKNNIINGRIYFNKRAFQLKYPNSDSKKMFELMYSNTSINSFFMRKFKIFKEYFELRPQTVSIITKKILDYHN